VSVIVDSIISVSYCLGTYLRLISVPNFTCRAPVIKNLPPPNRELIISIVQRPCCCFTIYPSSCNKTPISCVSQSFKLVSLPYYYYRLWEITNASTRVGQPQMALHSCNFFFSENQLVQKFIRGYSIRAHGQHGDVIRRRKQKNKKTSVHVPLCCRSFK
jgi:hypothetical protein